MTFVENHDTESRRDLVPKNIQPEDKPLAYAYILTSEGFPCVFYKDYSRDTGCLGMQLQPILINLIWIHQTIADGPTQQRWKDPGLFVFERLGGAHLLVALNKDKGNARTIHGVVTGFGPNVRLHDYTGHAPDIWTDGEGHVSIDVPRNAGGLGYVCYSVAGINGGFATVPSAVTQTFEGATDLDIKPADNTATVQVSRICVAQGTQVAASLTFDDTGWTARTQIVLSLHGRPAAQCGQRYTARDRAATGSPLAAGAEGWYTFYVHSSSTPTSNPKPGYKLTVNYTAPKV